MRLKEPGWWYAEPARDGVGARALGPLGELYGALVEARFKRGEPYRSKLPVICIGNFTAGGTGKTPLALLVIEHLQSLGERPACLTRGYGGRRRGVAWVDPAADTAREVGDEPLIIARVGATLVASDRRAGAQAIEEASAGHTVIVMDDGMQNPGLKKDLTIAVIDGARGLGNARVMPAGPLRAPLDFQLGLVDCIVVNGGRGEADGRAGSVLEDLRRGFPGPVLSARAEPAGDVDWVKEAPIVAYAGIGNPGRFFDLLTGLGADVLERRAFGDHHPFSEVDAEALLATADERGAQLITTEKDWVRLAGTTGKCAALRARSRALPIRLALNERDRARLFALVEAALKTSGKGRSG